MFRRIVQGVTGGSPPDFGNDRPNAQFGPYWDHDTGRPVIFLHILKTAGTAFRSFLEGSLPADQVLIDLGDHAQAAAAREWFDTASAEQRQKIRVVFGHLSEVFRDLYPEADYATVVRDPVRRALSQYVYEHFNASELGLDVEGRPMLGDLTRSEFWDLFLAWGTSYRAGNFNLQARTMAVFLGIEPDELTPSDVPDMVDRFGIVGVQDQFALFVFLFCRILGIPPRPVPVVYSFATGMEHYVPQWVSDEILRAGNLDAALYRAVHDRFDRSVAWLFAMDPKAENDWDSYRRETVSLMKT